MKNRHILPIILILAAVLIIFAGCNNGSGNAAAQGNTAGNAAANESQGEKAPVADGTYTVKFDTDSSMFHINEAYKGKATLTVKDGKMTVHITLASKKIINLYYGLAADAAKAGAKIIAPTTDTVEYSDGTTEEVYGFDVPVPYLDKEFDCAILGTKGTWYDHKVSVSDPQPVK